MVRKSKSTDHYEIKSPSKYPSTSPSHSKSPISKREVQKTTTAENLNLSEKSTLKSPEVQCLIHTLQGFSISPQKYELSQGSVTSQYIPSHPLTRLQSEKLGIEPIEFPLPKRKSERKTLEESDSETLSSSSSII